jgi:VWFA-related protein
MPMSVVIRMYTRPRALAALLVLAATTAVSQQPPVAPPNSQSAPTTQQSAAPPASQQPTQNPDGTYTMRVSTRIVVLDVVATDKQGNIVNGLSKEDFHITEDSDPQTITNFELGGSRVPAQTADIESTADLDRLAPRAPVNIILLDEFNTRFEDMAFAQYSLKKYLEKQPDHLTTPTMLIAVQIDKFDVLNDYTQDKQKLLDSLKHHFSGNPWRNNSTSWAPERYGTAFLTLRRVSEATVGHQGHKNMIWIGRGFPAIHLESQPVDTMNRLNSIRQDVVNQMRDARITLTTIDPAGLLIDPGVYGEAAAFNDPFGGNYQFAQLAKATGGRTIYGRNDVDVQIGAAADEGTNFYTLVYHPTNNSRDAFKFRKINITVNRPGVTLSSLQGYYLQLRPRPVDPKAPNRRVLSDLAAASDSKMAYDGADIKVTRLAKPDNGFGIAVAARNLAWTLGTPEDPTRKTELVVAVSTFDKKGKLIKEKASDMRFKAPADSPATGRIEVPLKFLYTLDPDPKAVRVRFVVRIGSSGRIGTQDVDLTQPIAANAPSLTAPAPAPPPPAQ